MDLRTETSHIPCSYIWNAAQNASTYNSLTLLQNLTCFRRRATRIQRDAFLGRTPTCRDHARRINNTLRLRRTPPSFEELTLSLAGGGVCNLACLRARGTCCCHAFPLVQCCRAQICVLCRLEYIILVDRAWLHEILFVPQITAFEHNYHMRI